MDVYWLEQTEADVPAENQWLSAKEAVCLGNMRFAKRRTDWRLGRWTAKRALSACFNLPSGLDALTNIEILAAPSGAPEVFLPIQTAPLTISISHRGGRAMCAVVLSGASLGCDLEMVEPRSDAFVADYFTVNEQAQVERALAEERSSLVTLLWSAKESALKALRVGLRLDTNCMEVGSIDALPLCAEQSRQDLRPVPLLGADPDRWRPLHVRCSGVEGFRGWWRHADHMVRTVVSAFPLRMPIHAISFSLESPDVAVLPRS